jgi:LuxR family transcriptional regulator, positive regulator of biofilm formation
MLTLREANVLALLAAGCSKKQIAARLGISAHTVVSHVRNTYRKLQVNSAAAAVMRAVQLQILSPDVVKELQDEAREVRVSCFGDTDGVVH